MDIFDILLQAGFWAATLRIATPLIFGVLGELICERAGVLNLGIEGIMTIGAMSGWLFVYLGFDLWTGILLAALVGAAFGLLHGLLTVPLGLSQHVTGIGITLLVYGVVAVIVKADDVGLAMANRGGLVSGPIGRTIVRLMPGFLQTLSLVGTAAMLWVGGGIILHGLEEFGFHAVPDAVHHVAGLIAAQAGTFTGLVGWFFNALGSGVIGLALGGVTAAVVGRLMPSATH